MKKMEDVGIGRVIDDSRQVYDRVASGAEAFAVGGLDSLLNISETEELNLLLESIYHRVSDSLSPTQFQESLVRILGLFDPRNIDNSLSLLGRVEFDYGNLIAEFYDELDSSTYAAFSEPDLAALMHRLVSLIWTQGDIAIMRSADDRAEILNAIGGAEIGLADSPRGSEYRNVVTKWVDFVTSALTMEYDDAGRPSGLHVFEAGGSFFVSRFGNYGVFGGGAVAYYGLSGLDDAWMYLSGSATFVAGAFSAKMAIPTVPSVSTYNGDTISLVFEPVSAVPEPSSTALLGLGGLALLLRRRR